MKKLPQDCKIGLFLLAVSVAIYCVIPFQTRNVGDHAALPPSFFPKVSAISLFVISVLIIIFSFKHFLKDSERTAFSTTINKAALFRVFGIISLMFLYVYCVSLAGYYVSTPIFLILTFFVFGFRNLKFIFVISIIFVLLAYLSFEKGLQVMLPRGSLF